MNSAATHFLPAPRHMERSAFMATFGGVYEHSAWVAESAWANGLAEAHDEVTGLASAFAEIVDAAGRTAGETLIRAHPDLAGKAAVAGTLTADSTAEQASAGLDQCTPAEFARFTDLNARYRERFGMPFIMAVRDSHRTAILAAFERRLAHDPEAEYAQAIEEIHTIARLRLQAIADGQARSLLAD